MWKMIKKIGRIVWNVIVAGALISVAFSIATFAADILKGGVKRLIALVKK